MNRSIESRSKLLGHGASRLRIGMIMLAGVVVSQAVVSVATGQGPLPGWSISPSAQQDGPRATREART